MDSQTQPPKILVTDDAPSELRVLSELLGGLACEHLLASSGDEALKLARRELPDLILLDVIMPVMDGYEVCARLKADRTTRDIPIIFLTGRTESADIVRGFEAGAVDYVPKPYNPPELLARVKTQLELKQKRDDERRLLAELQLALSQIRQLSGLIPICAGCKRIRDDSGYWQQVEEYVTEHSDATFTHGLCPDCVEAYFPELGPPQAKS